MKIIKKILLGIVAIIALLLIIAIFLKKEYTVERSITINKPKQELFDYIKLLKNQDNFSVWAKKDPNMKKEYTGTDGTVGFVSAWDSDNKDVGKGEQEITKIEEGNRVDYALRFLKPMEGNATAYLSTEAAAETQTNVKWGIQGRMAYPMNIMQLFMSMDKMLGADLEQGLASLKEIMEKQ